MNKLKAKISQVTYNKDASHCHRLDKMTERVELGILAAIRGRHREGRLIVLGEPGVNGECNKWQQAKVL